VAISWDGTMSINDIIDKINTGSGGSIHATFDQTLRKMFIYSQAPLQVYDDAGIGFAHAMKLSAIASSSAPINNNVVAAFNQVDPNLPLNGTLNTLDLFTNASPIIPGVSYQFQVDNSIIAWLPTDDSVTLLFNVQFGTPLGQRVFFTFDSTRQVVVFNKSGDPGDNPGTLLVGNPMKAIQLSDVTGNLTRVYNFDTQENAQRLFDEMKTGLTGNASSETALEAQAQALVDGTKALQDAESAVNLDEELAQARLYQRSYEASVRLQFILDEILNVLINHTGSSASSSSF